VSNDTNLFDTGRGRTFNGSQLVTGVNKDALNIKAGLQELTRCGYDDPKTIMVIEYALARWSRGEETQAHKGAIDASFHGVNLISWTRVLAAAMAGATP